ncbi:MAG: TonB-dependent receptor [Campylobacteraceae bacterium]|jgi:outer membrane receptor for ferrienterochelin and colicins|nr:TonB-dependent receptor [Campylobacteraceae bacterium]
MKRKLFAVPILLGLLDGALFALNATDAKELEAIKVVSAAGYEQNIADAPASVFVITKEELENKSFNDLTDILKNVPGVNIEGGSVFKDISIRGMSSAYTMYLIDGKPMSGNEAHSPNGMAGGIATNSLPPVSMIERIEVVRGPMSSLYGSEAMGGVINIITKKAPKEWTGSLKGEYTKSFNDISNDGYQTNLYLAGPVINDRLSLQTNGAFLGLDESSVQSGGKSRSSNPDFKRRQAGAKLILALNDANDLWLGYDYSKQQRVTTPGKSTPAQSCDSKTGKCTDNKVSESLALKQTYSVGHDAKYSDFVINTYLQNSLTKNNRGAGIDYEVLLANTQGTYFFERNSFTAGAQYKKETLDDRATNKFSVTQIKKSSYSVFAEDEWSVSDSFALTGGVRYNNDDHFGSYVNPRLYAVLNLTDEFVLKGGISTGYKQPSLRQSADDFGGVTGGGRLNGVMLGNPDLEPEKSLNYEIGTSYDNQDIGLNVGFTAFYSDFKDKIVELKACETPKGASANCDYNGGKFDFINVFDNVEKAELYGVELSFKYAILSSLITTGSYTYQKSNQKKGNYAGFPLNDTPKNLATLGLEYAPNSKLSFWTQTNYRGKADYFKASRADNTATNKAYTLVDLGVNYALKESLKLNAGLYNALNKEIDSASYGKYIDGRRVTVGFNANF